MFSIILNRLPICPCREIFISILKTIFFACFSVGLEFGLCGAQLRNDSGDWLVFLKRKLMNRIRCSVSCTNDVGREV